MSLETYTMKQVIERHRERGLAVTMKQKRRGYADAKTYRREEWAMHVLFHVERYLSTHELDHGFELVMMWKHRHAEVKGRLARDLLYNGDIDSNQFVNQCANTFFKMSNQLIVLGVSVKEIPLEFFRQEMEKLRVAEELIQPASAILTQKKFDLICESDTKAVDAMYMKIADKFLVHSNG